MSNEWKFIFEEKNVFRYEKFSPELGPHSPESNLKKVGNVHFKLY